MGDISDISCFSYDMLKYEQDHLMSIYIKVKNYFLCSLKKIQGLYTMYSHCYVISFICYTASCYKMSCVCHESIGCLKHFFTQHLIHHLLCYSVTTGTDPCMVLFPTLKKYVKILGCHYNH